MKLRITIPIAVISLFSGYCFAVEPTDEQLKEASGYFNRVKEICDRDGGALWGVDIYAPVLFIDNDRNIFANEGQCGFLTPGPYGIYTGTYPIDKQIVNSVTEIEGKKWTTVKWPLPEDKLSRNILIVHEMFHYRQDGIGLSPLPYANDHMEQVEARILLKLEWAALAEAMRSGTDSGFKDAVADALSFRARRRFLFEHAARNENRFEVHEGIPEYTARKLCCGSDREIERLILDEVDPESEIPMVRYFAYVSGPMYGHLLDKSGLQWHSDLTADSDLGAMLGAALGNDRGDGTGDIRQRGSKYGYDRIADFEHGLSAKRNILLETYRKNLIIGPTLKIPMEEMSIAFDPGLVYSLEEAGTVYETIRIVTRAGILEVSSGGCLITPDWTTAYVSADGLEIDGTELIGDGWKMSASPGMEIEKNGDNISLIHS